MSNLSTKTQNAIAKYGMDVCIEAAKLADEGEGGSTVGFYLGLRTNQADAAINAGFELRMRNNSLEEVQMLAARTSEAA